SAISCTKLYWQLLDSIEERTPDRSKLRLGDLHRFEAVKHRREGSSRFETCQMCSETEVDAIAEGEMLVRRSIRNERVGIVELVAIVVCRTVPRDDSVACFDIVIAELCVGCCYS